MIEVLEDAQTAVETDLFVVLIGFPGSASSI